MTCERCKGETPPPGMMCRACGNSTPRVRVVHHCHAKGCQTTCAPERLMCLTHWRMVPRALQWAVWATYRPGQCDDKDPSDAWHVAADAAIAAVAAKERA